MTREHFWPQWLIERARPKAVRWQTKRIPAQSATIALCKSCNDSFGHEIESPVAHLFDEIENGEGLSEFEAELLVRWLWKFEGLSWLQEYPRLSYSAGLTLRDRVLNRLDGIRSRLSLGVSVIDHLDPSYDDAPMGIDSPHHTTGIFVSGVFCRIAVMCFLSEAAELVPSQFSIFKFRDSSSHAGEHCKLFYPKTGFLDDVEAVGVTRTCSFALAGFHDAIARRIREHSMAP